MKGRRTESIKPLWLTQEEAFNLLGLAVTSASNLGDAEDPALQKLGALCRAFLRDTTAAPAVSNERPRRARRRLLFPMAA